MLNLVYTEIFIFLIYRWNIIWGVPVGLIAISENDTVEGSTSRRTVLKGVGGAITTASVSQVAAANVLDDAEMVEIPKAMHGSEVVRTKEVPRKWWQHIE